MIATLKRSVEYMSVMTTNTNGRNGICCCLFLAHHIDQSTFNLFLSRRFFVWMYQARKNMKVHVRKMNRIWSDKTKRNENEFYLKSEKHGFFFMKLWVSAVWILAKCPSLMRYDAIFTLIKSRVNFLLRHLHTPFVRLLWFTCFSSNESGAYAKLISWTIWVNKQLVWSWMRMWTWKFYLWYMIQDAQLLRQREFSKQWKMNV